MDKKEIPGFIIKNRIAFVATTEDTQPHVRVLRTLWADENGIFFSMPVYKDVYRQLVNNPKTEICYFSDSVQIRVKGQMEPVTDEAIKNDLAENSPNVKATVEKEGWDAVCIFRVKNAKAAVLDLKTAQIPTPNEKTWIDL